MTILFVDFKLVRRLIPLVALASVIAVALAVFIYGTGSEASTQFEDSATNEGTWNWRVEAWQTSISDDTQTIPSIVFGQPMGSGYVRFDSSTGGYENLPPHSEYVGQYLRVGILGLPLFLAFLLRPLLRLYELQRKDPFAIFPSASVWCLITVGILVYGITYGYDASTIALVGVANAALLSLRSRPTEQSIYALSPNERVLASQPSNGALI
jgi:O-antigen ligase